MSRIALVGHSMGGCAVLHYGNRNDRIDTIVALQPYNGGPAYIEWVGGKNLVLGDKLENHKANTLILTGNKDTVASPEKTYKFYENLQFSEGSEAQACFISIKNANHAHCVHVFSNSTTAGNEKNSRIYSMYRMLVLSFLVKNFQLEVRREEEIDFFDEGTTAYEALLPYLEGVEKYGVPAYSSKRVR